MENTRPNWVLVKKICELTGYTDDAIRAKIKRGDWQKDKLWRKAPDNRIVIDANAVNRWLGGEHA